MAKHRTLDWARSTMCSLHQPCRRKRTTAMWRAWRCCSPAAAGRIPGATINRLCGSGLDALGHCSPRDQDGRGGPDDCWWRRGWSRAPFVMPKAESAFSRSNAVAATPPSAGASSNKLMEKVRRRLDAETAENVATDYKIERREARDRMALGVTAKGGRRAQKSGFSTVKQCR